MNNYGGEMKKYTVIGLEVLVSAIFIIAIVILALNINKNNKLQNSKKDNVVQNNQETINETHRELLERNTEETKNVNESSESIQYENDETVVESEESDEQDTEIAIETEVELTETEGNDTVNTISIDKLYELVDNNVFLLLSVFNGSPTILSNESSGRYIKVDTNVFAKYSEFYNMVHSVYCNDQASYYITTGCPGYTDINGDLYFDTNYMAGGGYYIIWDGYSITVNDNSDNECHFSVNVKYQGPMTSNIVTDKIINGTAIYENGRWVLTKMLR